MRFSHSSGVSLVELMIVVAIIGIMFSMCAGGAIGFGGGCVTTSSRETSAQRNAVAFANQMGITITGVQCSGSDSDHDGYVSCTLNLSEDKMRSIQCGYDMTIAPLGQNTSCKLTMPINVQSASQ